MFWKKQLPLIIAFFVGTLLLIQYFVPGKLSETFFNLYLDWVIVIGIFGSILGYYSMIRVHIVRVKKKMPNWQYSGITLLVLLAMCILPIFEGRGPGSFFDNMFHYVMVSIEGTMFSLLAFYISSAAYRAFRARSAQATALLIAAVLVMLGRVPIGEYISFWGKPTLVDIANWILNYPNMAAKRAIFLGIGLGGLLLSLKLLLGIERSYLGGKE